MTTQPDPTAALAILKTLLAHADETVANALKSHQEATALAAGKRGRKPAVAEASIALSVARQGRQHIVAELLKATRATNQGKLDQVIGEALVKAFATPNPLLGDIMSARGVDRRQIRITDEKTGKQVHARVTFNRYGLPTYVELTRLATVEATIASLNRWRTAATERLTVAADKEAATKEIADIDAWLADPVRYPMSANGSSITVTPNYGTDDAPWGINASTWRIESEDQVAEMTALINVAFALRTVLNAAKLPAEEALYEIHNGGFNG